MLNSFSEWWKQPYKSDGNVATWFLFTGLILVIIFLWSRILREAGHFIGE